MAVGVLANPKALLLVAVLVGGGVFAAVTFLPQDPLKDVEEGVASELAFNVDIVDGANGYTLANARVPYKLTARPASFSETDVGASFAPLATTTTPTTTNCQGLRLYTTFEVGGSKHFSVPFDFVQLETQDPQSKKWVGGVAVSIYRIDGGKEVIVESGKTDSKGYWESKEFPTHPGHVYVTKASKPGYCRVVSEQLTAKPGSVIPLPGPTNSTGQAPVVTDPLLLHVNAAVSGAIQARGVASNITITGHIIVDTFGATHRTSLPTLTLPASGGAISAYGAMFNVTKQSIYSDSGRASDIRMTLEAKATGESGQPIAEHATLVLKWQRKADGTVILTAPPASIVSLSLLDDGTYGSRTRTYTPS